ncbi:MAG: hypothetical protein NC420_09390 [Eubacterium sp.]|nr:hypothetical protein [Eubacterium sp.]
MMGNVYLKNVDQGWLVSTGALSKDALGIKVEWESRIDSERKKFSFYTYDRVIEQLISSGIIVPSQDIINEIKNETVAENIVLMLTDSGYYWIILIVDKIHRVIVRLL